MSRNLKLIAGAGAAVLVQGCGGGGGGGGITASTLTSAVSQLTQAPVAGTSASGSGDVQSGSSLAVSSSTAPVFKTSSQGAALSKLNPTYANAPALLSSSASVSANNVLTQTGTAKVALSSGGTQTVNVTSFEDSGQSSSLVFVGGQQASAGNRTQAAGGSEVALEGTSQSFIATGEQLDDALTVSGRYVYTGIIAWSFTNRYAGIRLGDATVTVDVDERSSRFNITGSTTHTSEVGGTETARLDVTQNGFAFDAKTGIFNIKSDPSSGDGFSVGASGTPVTVEIRGMFSGLGAQAVAGLFNSVGFDSLQTPGDRYLGGFMGSGAISPAQRYSRRLRDGGGIVALALDATLAEGQIDTTNIHFATDSYRLLHAHMHSPFQNSARHGLIGKINAVDLSGTAGEIVKQGIGIWRKDASLTHRNGPLPIEGYASQGDSSKLLLIADSDRGDIGNLFVASGERFTGAGSVTGNYTFRGVQLVDERGSFGGAVPEAIRISVDFGSSGQGEAGSFAYSTTSSSATAGVSGTGRVDRARGLISSNDSEFNVTPRGGESKSAEMHGRFSGNWKGVSGVLVTVTDSGTQYAGGFIAGPPQLARTTHALGTTGAGFGVADITLNQDASRRSLAFLSSDIDAIAYEINDASNAGSAASLVDSIAISTQAGHFTETQAGGVTKRAGGSYAYRSGKAGIDLFSVGKAGIVDAELLVVDGSTATPSAESFIGYFANARTDRIAAGSYEWRGRHLIAQMGALQTHQEGNFSIEASFAAGVTQDRFTYATLSPTPTQKTLSGSGTINVLTGAIASDSMSLRSGGGAGGAIGGPVRLRGEVTGESDAAVVGLFATTGPSGTQYGGGFVGARPSTTGRPVQTGSSNEQTGGQEQQTASSSQKPAPTDEVFFISATAAADVSLQSGKPSWLVALLKADLGNANTSMQDGSGADETRTAGYKSGEITSYRTTATYSAAPTFAQMYFQNPASGADRIVVAGTDFDGSWIKTQAGTFSYYGRITLPQLAETAGVLDHDETIPLSRSRTTVNLDSREVSLQASFLDSASGDTHSMSTGSMELDIARGQFSATSRFDFTVATGLPETAVSYFKSGTQRNLQGQVFGSRANAIGGVYWGKANGTSVDAPFARGDDGKNVGGAFIGSR